MLHRMTPEVMLWTAPPPGARECHEGRGAWAPNDSEEPGHADDHDDWSRYREVGFSGSRHRSRWQRSCSPSAQAALCSDVLCEAAAVPNWHRGMRVITLLVARAPGARSHRTADATGLRQALRQTTQERCGRRGSDLRSRHPAKHALRADQD